MTVLGIAAGASQNQGLWAQEAACLASGLSPEASSPLEQYRLWRCLGIQKRQAFIRQPGESQPGESQTGESQARGSGWTGSADLVGTASLNAGPVQLISYDDAGTEAPIPVPAVIRMQLTASQDTQMDLVPLATVSPNLPVALSSKIEAPSATKEEPRSPTVQFRLSNSNPKPTARFTIAAESADRSELPELPPSISNTVPETERRSAQIQFVGTPAGSVPSTKTPQVPARNESVPSIAMTLTAQNHAAGELATNPESSEQKDRTPELVRVPLQAVQSSVRSQLEEHETKASEAINVRLSDDNQESDAPSASFDSLKSSGPEGLISQPKEEAVEGSSIFESFPDSVAIEIAKDVNVSRRSEPFPKDASTSVMLSVVHMNAQIVKLSASVARLMVEDEDICTAIRVSSNEFSIVGKQVGKTRVAVWVSETAEANNKPVLIEVSVNRPHQVAVTESSKGMQELTDLVAKMHPGSEVEIVSSPDGSMTVKGKVSDEASAKQIMLLIRKMCLVPVYDKLIVSSR
jgi:hypothetical protein